MVFTLLLCALAVSQAVSVGELPFAWRGASPGDYAKWSALRYGFRAKEDHDAEEETHKPEEIVAKLRQVECAGVAGAERCRCGT
jgi:hypothetical protein